MKKFTRWWMLGLIIALFMITPAPEIAEAGGPWYVAPGGDDSNDCLSPGSACETINGAIGKATTGDTIYIAEGIYTNSGSQVILISKDIMLNGGWDTSFTSQNGFTVIDGADARRGITISWGMSVNLENLILTNGSTGSGGGGVHAGGGDLTIQNSSIFDNYAYAGGGGITVVSNSLVLENSSVNNNMSPQWGGGIFSSCSDIYINNSTISENSTDSGGGGISHDCLTVLSINSSSIIGNYAEGQSGGGFRTFGEAALQNSIVAGNTSDQGGNDCSGDVTSLGYNIIGDRTGCTITSTSGDKFDTDPVVGPVVGQPGFNPLLANSPAIDAGDPAGCTDHTGGPITIDQRSWLRPIDGDGNGIAVCDIGAYEATINLYLPVILR